MCKCILLYIDTNIPPYHLVSFTSSALLYPLNSHCIYTRMIPLNEMALLPKSRPTCSAFLRRAAPEPGMDQTWRVRRPQNVWQSFVVTRCNKSPNSWVPQNMNMSRTKSTLGISWDLCGTLINARVTGRKQNAIALWFPWRSWQLHAFSAREGPTLRVCVSLAMFPCVERETWETIVILMCIYIYM